MSDPSAARIREPWLSCVTVNVFGSERNAVLLAVVSPPRAATAGAEMAAASTPRTMDAATNAGSSRTVLRTSCLANLTHDDRHEVLIVS